MMSISLFLSICIPNTFYSQTLISVINDKLKSEDAKIDQMSKILSAGGSANERADKELLRPTILMIASEKGYYKMVEFLLGYLPDINALDNNRASALAYAARNGHLQIVRLLLHNGADAKLGNNIITDVLKSYGPTFSEIKKNNLKASETYNQNISQIIGLLIDSGVDKNQKDKQYSLSPIIWAASYNAWNLVDLLKAKGADLTGLAQHLPVDQKNKPLTSQEKQYFEKLRKDIKNYALEEGWHRI